MLMLGLAMFQSWATEADPCVDPGAGIALVDLVYCCSFDLRHLCGGANSMVTQSIITGVHVQLHHCSVNSWEGTAVLVESTHNETNKGLRNPADDVSPQRQPSVFNMSCWRPSVCILYIRQSCKSPMPSGTLARQKPRLLPGPAQEPGYS
jgi:hypothetical protein